MLSSQMLSQPRLVTEDNIYAGVDAQDVAEVAKQFGVSQKVISDLLGVSIRAVQNRRRENNDKLDKNASERLLRLQELMTLAVDYFGDETGAKDWFSSINMGLGQRAPLSLCDTFHGMDRVENSLIKLMHGMTA